MSTLVLNLKKTLPINIVQVIKDYVAQYYGAPAFTAITPAIEKMHNLRLSLDYSRIQLAVATDPKEGEKFAEHILTYLLFCRLLQSRFRLETHQEHAIKFEVHWNDSYDSSRQLTIASMNFEISAVLYNYAAVQFAAGQNYVSRNTPEDRKSGLNCLRQAQWALQELKRTSAQLRTDVLSAQLDFSLPNIDSINYLIQGIEYQAFYHNFLPMEKQEGPNQIAQFAGESGRNYQNASQTLLVILNDKTRPLTNVRNYFFLITKFQETTAALKKYHAAAVFGRGVMMAEAAKKMYTYYIGQHDMETTKGHFGMSLGYLRKGKEFLKLVIDNQEVFTALTTDQKSQIEAMLKDFEKLLPAAEQRNAQVYKQRVLSDSELPGMVIDNQMFVIKPKIPPAYEKQLPESEAFAGFLSEDQVAKSNEIKTFAEQKKAESNASLKTLLEQKNKAYLDNFINTFLDIINTAEQHALQSNTIPPTIQQKLQKFRELGGKNQLQQITQSLRETSVNCGMMLHNIRQSLNDEAAEDSKLRQTYQEQWTPIPSERLTQDDYRKIADLEQKFQIAQKADMDILAGISHNQQYLDLADKGEAQILQNLPKSNELYFIQQNGQQLRNLQQANAASEAKLEEVRSKVQEIEQMITNYNYMQATALAYKQGVHQDQILITVLQPIAQQIEAMNQLINQARGLIGQVIFIANELSTIRNNQSSVTGGNMQRQEEISAGFTNLCDIYEMVNGGVGFYNQLTSRLCDLDKRVNDYLKSRQMERDGVLLQIQNKKNLAAPQTFGGFNQAAPQYFNYSQFAMGNQQQQNQAQQPSHLQQPFYQQGQFSNNAVSGFVPNNPNQLGGRK